MNKERKAIIESNEISQVYEFTLGGYKQKVLIEGKKKELPIVVTLHGGPGSPIPFSVGCRGLFPEFTDKFLMVYWDQLGCGINNRVIDASFTIDMFVQMAQELLQKVKELFPNNALYIFSTSWGSILSARVLESSSSIVNGVVAWGQMVKDCFYNSEVVNALEESKVSRKKLEIIKNIKESEITYQELKLTATSLQKYTKAYQNKDGESAPMGKMIMGLLKSPDYKFKDFMAIVKNGYVGNVSLWKEILTLDFTKLLSEVQIPYVIVQGDTDVVASTKIVKELVVKANNPNLKLLVVKNSGHIPGKEGVDTVFQKLDEMACGAC